MAVNRRRHPRLMNQINVVPYIDVMLVLLIIFMMTAHAMEYGIEIDVPKTRQVAEKSTLDLPIVQITHESSSRSTGPKTTI